jgi:hypothetical protein
MAAMRCTRLFVFSERHTWSLSALVAISLKGTCGYSCRRSCTALRYGYGTVTLRVGVLLRYVTPPYKGRTYVTPVTSFIGGTELACVDQSLFRSDDCDLACRRLVHFVWPEANFIFDLAILVPPRLIRASCRYSFFLLSHVSNNRLCFLSPLDSICKKSQ